MILQTNKRTLLIAVLSLLFQASIVIAQSTLFSYQGRLLDAGSPANGDYEIEFKLFDAVIAGTQIGLPVIATVTVANGSFTAPLDFGAAAFDGAARPQQPVQRLHHRPGLVGHHAGCDDRYFHGDLLGNFRLPLRRAGLFRLRLLVVSKDEEGLRRHPLIHPLIEIGRPTIPDWSASSGHARPGGRSRRLSLRGVPGKT